MVRQNPYPLARLCLAFTKRSCIGFIILFVLLDKSTLLYYTGDLLSCIITIQMYGRGRSPDQVGLAEESSIAKLAPLGAPTVHFPLLLCPVQVHWFVITSQMHRKNFPAVCDK